MSMEYAQHSQYIWVLLEPALYWEIENKPRFGQNSPWILALPKLRLRPKSVLHLPIKSGYRYQQNWKYLQNVITSTGNSKLCNLPRNIWMAIMMPTFYIHTRFPYNQLHTGKFCCLDLGLVEPCPCIVC